MIAHAAALKGKDGILTIGGTGAIVLERKEKFTSIVGMGTYFR